MKVTDMSGHDFVATHAKIERWYRTDSGGYFYPMECDHDVIGSGNVAGILLTEDGEIRYTDCFNAEATITGPVKLQVAALTVLPGHKEES